MNPSQNSGDYDGNIRQSNQQLMRLRFTVWIYASIMASKDSIAMLLLLCWLAIFIVMERSCSRKMRSDIEGLTKKRPDFFQKKRIFYQFEGRDPFVMTLLGAKFDSLSMACPDQHKNAVG